MNHPSNSPAITCTFRSDWDVRKTGMSGSGSPMMMIQGDQAGSSWANQGPVGPTSRSTDCLDLDATNTDLSTLDLGNIDESRDELDFMLNVTSTDKLGQTSIYYTMDSRRMASKHKKNQQDRKLLYGVK